jgi:uncharacterized protein YutE (UPF0331/DUF86 family)
MKYNLELLKADITEELEKLRRLEEEFAGAQNLLQLPPEKVPFYHRGAVGYLLHSFYNGCENIFRSIARFFENDVYPQTWHRDLLKRMKLEIPGYRPRVIDEELFRLLDNFRGFRHKFRHSYSFDLDWERERQVALKLPKALKLFTEQIRNFLEILEELDGKS